MEENKLPENIEPNDRDEELGDDEENEENEDEYDKNYTPCPFCGNYDFCTQPNSYDIYEIYEGKLVLVRSEDTYDEFKIYCRECSEEFPLTKEII